MRARRNLQYQLSMGEPHGYEVDGGQLLTGLARYFPSGCNQLSDVRGARRAVSNFGFSTSDLTQAARREVLELLYKARPFHPATGWRVFVDTGAFGEVAISEAGRPVVVSPISSVAWSERMGTAELLARVGGKRVHVVAPDRVGDQLHTLSLLHDWRELLLNVAVCLGARVIVPVQQGVWSMAAFASRALEVLSAGAPRPWYTPIWGIPSKKDATSLKDLEAFARCLPSGSAVHFLGMGPHSPRYESARRLVVSLVEGVEVWSDSVRVKALVGQGRAITKGTRAAEALGLSEPRAHAVAQALVGDEAERVARARAAGWRDE